MAKKSQHIQCRLHPDTEYEENALAYYNQKLSEGFSPRQIITDALCRSANFTPDMFPQDKGRVTVGKIENLLADFAHEIMRSIDSRPLRQSPQSEIEDNTIDDMEYAENIAKAYMNRRNRGK
jgi:hypothetical protein